jgi:hypothetical protein
VLVLGSRSIEVLVGVRYAWVPRVHDPCPWAELARRRELSVTEKSWMPKYWPTMERE